MRIKKLHLVGLAAALAGGVGAENAEATDRTISTATTTPVTTAQPEPPTNVTPGNITVASAGSITVTANQTAITVNSNNNVVNDGALRSNNAINTTGVLLTGGFTGNVTNNFLISLVEDFTPTDTDNDGNLDGDWASAGVANRHGILLNSGPAFTGNISLTGDITVEGNSSSGITLGALLNGDLTQGTASTISITGDNSYGVAITGGVGAGVNGDVLLRGDVQVRGENSSALLVDAPITGSLNINGNWRATGYFNSGAFIPTTTGLDPDDLQQSGPTIAVYGSVTGGIMIEGIGVEDDSDDDFDGVIDTGTSADPNDDLTASISSLGSGPALLIQADGSNVVLGATSTGFGLHVRGLVASSGVYNGFNATAIRIDGVGPSTVQIADGIALDNSVRATAFEGDAIALHIDSGANISEILTRKEVAGAVVSDLADTAYGIVIESGASAPSYSNTGVVRAQLFGEIGDAVAFVDRSNTVANITNTGTIFTQIIPTDADVTDDIPPPTPTGDAIAIDVSASSINVTLTQMVESPVFNDDDGDDDDTNARPSILIEGDVLFGSGNDTLNLLAGDINGDVSFGTGFDTLLIDNDAELFGRITDSDGSLVIDVQEGALRHAGGTTNITSANFSADSILTIVLSQTVGQSSVINASGAVTFAPGAVITPIVPTGLPVSGSHTFLTAGTLNGAANVVGAVTSGTPFLYSVSISTAGPNSLQASYAMRTPTQLGLNENQSAAFDNIIAALRLDDDAALAFSSLSTQATFIDSYADLMPSFSSAAAELATTAIQQSQSAATNRLAHTRLHGLDEVSAWAQEIGYGLERTPSTIEGQEYSGHGFGFAVGIDGPLENGALFGVAASLVTSEAEEPQRPEGEISTWLAQANAYLGTAMGPIDLDFVAGAGVGKMQSRRFIEIGSDFNARTDADWWAFEGHGAVRASLPLALSDWMVITPQAALTYVMLNEQGYDESGGGAAFDLEADSATSQRLWADAGIEISTRWRMGSDGYIAPRIYAGYRANAIDEEAERTFRFASAGSDFTLTDEPLGDGGPLIGIGIDATNGYSTFSLSYEGEFGDQIERNSLNAAVRFRF
jgi:uncharacterized protein with beta-barrel porin domain